jgi:predicted enzyme related to lactoylglutathione lyase
VSKIESYAPGAFCWADLSTADPEGAKRFYREMFGWESFDVPARDGAYTMFHIGGDTVAGMMGSRPGMRSNWNVYFATPNADACVARVVETGGEVLHGPLDAMSAGRYAVAKDPQGAVFGLWQAATHIGATYAGGPGQVVWPELATRDAAGSAAFYKALFGWGTKPESGVEAAPYTEWQQNGRSVGGMLPMNGPQWENIPPKWGCYVVVADCDERAAKAQQLGGKLHMQPTDIPNTGRFAVVADPHGAVICIIQLTGAH